MAPGRNDDRQPAINPSTHPPPHRRTHLRLVHRRFQFSSLLPVLGVRRRGAVVAQQRAVPGERSGQQG